MKLVALYSRGDRMCVNSMSVCSIENDRDTAVAREEMRTSWRGRERKEPIRTPAPRRRSGQSLSNILPKCLWVNGEGAGGTQNVAHVKTFKATIDRPSPPNLKPTPSLCLLDAAAIAHRGRRDPAAVATACAKKLRKK